MPFPFLLIVSREQKKILRRIRDDDLIFILHNEKLRVPAPFDLVRGESFVFLQLQKTFTKGNVANRRAVGRPKVHLVAPGANRQIHADFGPLKGLYRGLLDQQANQLEALDLPDPDHVWDRVWGLWKMGTVFRCQEARVAAEAEGADADGREGLVQRRLYVGQFEAGGFLGDVCGLIERGYIW